ncbi:MAG: arginine repressor [Clostridia bacterium]|nr:arginine repressor [Clostridia bacterium]
MKARRHQRILDIVRNRVIQTQEELAAELAQDGIAVTQATVSRDIKELRLIKVPVGNGTYRYSIPAERNVEDINRRIERMFRDVVVNIEDSLNLVVVKTVEGAAQAVAAIIDDLEWAQIVGTLAGDDTIILVIKPVEAAPDIMSRLNRFRKQP